MAYETRQRYGLATGKGLEPAPGGPKVRFAKGGAVRAGGVRQKSGPGGFAKNPKKGC